MSADDGAPLAFATVGVEGAGTTVFADSTGHFRLGHLASGALRVQARELGFAQADTVITLDAGRGDIDVRITLRRIVHALPRVAIRGTQQCRVAAAADSSTDPALDALTTELEHNADRADLLTSEAPFEYSVEAEVIQRSEYHPERDRDEVDTIVYSSDDRHPYRAGHLLDARFIGRRRTERYSGPYIYLPDLPDLSQANFLAHHCLSFGGVDTVGGRPEIRLEFRPLHRMREADAEGTFFLDPRRYVVTRATMRLTNGDHLVPPIRRLEGTIWYRELVPLVAIEDSARYDMVAGSPLTGGEITSTETQRVISTRSRPPRKARPR